MPQSNPFRFSSVALLAAAFLAGAPRAAAATLTWDSDGTFANGSTDGAGTWSTVNANWRGAASPDVVWSNSTLDTAVFGSAGTAGAVTVSGTVNVGALTFNNGTTGNYTISGGTLNGLGTITNSMATGTTTVASNITRAGGLTFNGGGGTLALNGALNVTGLSLNGSGVITLGGSSANITGDVHMYSNGVTLVLAKTSGVAVSGDLYLGNGGFPGGWCELGASNQLATTSTIICNTDNNTGAVAVFSMKGFNQTLAGISGAWRGTQNYIQNGGGTDSTLTFAGAATNTFSNGQIQDGGTGKLNVVMNGAGTQNFNSTTSYTGTTTVTQGTLGLIGVNFNSSATTVNGGTLNIQASNVHTSIAGASGQVTITGGSNSNFGGGFNKTYSATTVLSGTSTSLTQTAGNSLSANSVMTIGTGATLNTGNFVGSVKALTGTGAVNLGTSGTLILADGAGQTFSGVISNSGSLTKAGAGTQALSGANTYTGTTAVSGGTLLLDFSAAAPATNNIVNNTANTSTLVLGGGTLEIKGRATAATQQFNGVGGGGTLRLTPSGGGTLTANLGAINAASAINFAGSDSAVGVLGTAQFVTTTTTTNDNGTTRLGANLWNGTDWASTANDGGVNRVVQWVGTYTDVYNGTTPGPIAIANGPTTDVRIKEATGGYINNTLSGNTTINSLLMVANGNGATVDTGGNTLTIGNGSGATGAVAIGAGAQSLTIGVAGGSAGSLTAGTSGGGVLVLNNQNAASTLTVNAIVKDNGAAVALGTAGRVVLAGVNTYAGNTTIGGTLQIAGTGSLGGAGANYTGAIANNGTLQYSSSATQKLSGVISGAGSLVKDTAASVLTLTGNNTYSGGTVISAGTLQIGDGTTNGAFGAGTYAIGAAGTLRVLRATDTSAPAWANITGAGTLTVMTNRANSGFTNDWGQAALGAGFTGTLQIERGRVYTSTQTSLGNAAAVVVKSGGHLGMWAGGTFNQNFTVEGTGYGEGGFESALRLANGGVTTTVNGTVTLSNSATLGATGTGIIAGVVSGGAGSTLSFGTSNQAGTVRLTGTNTYSGNTAIGFGTLQIGGAGTLGSGNYSGAIANGGTLQYSSSSSQTLSGTLSGAGALTKDTSAASTLTLTGTNTYTGNTTLNAGTLQIGGAGTLGAGNYGGKITMANNSSLAYNSSSDQVLGGAISGAGSLTQSGSGTLTLAAHNTYTGATTISGGTLKIGGTRDTTGAVAWLDASQLSAGAATTWSNLIVVGGSVGNFTGGGTVQAGGAQYGNLNVMHFNGSQIFSNLGATSANMTILYVGGMDGTQNQRLVGNVSSAAGNWLLGYWNNTQDRAYFGSFLSSGTAVDATTEQFYSAVINAGNVSTYSGLGLMGAGAGSATGGVALGGSYGAGEYSKGAVGEVLIFNSALTQAQLRQNQAYLLAKWSGGVLPTGTAVNITNAGAMLDINGFRETIASLSGVAGSSVILSNATNGSGQLTVGDATNTVFAGAISDGTGSGGALTKQGSGTLTLGGANTYTGGTDVQNGTLQLTGSLATTTTLNLGNGTSSGKFILGGAGGAVNQTVADLTTTGTGVANAVVGGNAAVSTLTVNKASGSTTFGGTLGGGGANENSLALTKTGAGTLTLTGTNTYTGTTTLAGGILALGSAGALNGTSAVTFTGGTLQYSSSNMVDYSAKVANSTGAITVDTNSQSVTWASALASNNTGGLTKSGTGTLTLASANNYTGTTTVNAGILEVTADGALGTGSSTIVNSGGTLKLTGVTYLTTEALTLNGTGAGNVGALLNSGTSTYAGAITIGAGGATINNGGAGSTLTLTGGVVKDGATVTFTGTGGKTIISGTGISGASPSSDLVVNGTTLVVTAASSYNGPTTVQNGGTLAGNVSIASTLVTVNADSFITAGADEGIGTKGILSLTGAVDLDGTYLVDLGLDAGISGTPADGTKSDLIAVTGNVDLTNLTMQLRGTNAPLPPAGTHYAIKLLSWTGTETGAVADGANFTNYTGLTLRADQSIVRHGNAYYLVPEPASFALLSLGSLLLLRRPSRRRGRAALA